eukprot:scaffold11400_cov65-Cyclotella_meneghiniana.AAC.1
MQVGSVDANNNVVCDPPAFDSETKATTAADRNDEINKQVISGLLMDSELKKKGDWRHLRDVLVMLKGTVHQFTSDQCILELQLATCNLLQHT